MKMNSYTTPTHTTHTATTAYNAHLPMCEKIDPAYRLFFTTLAHEKRLQILNAIRKKPLNATEIGKMTGIEQTLLSHHLQILVHHGMVFVEKRKQFKYYSLNQETIQPLLWLIDAHMKQYCCKILEGKR